MDSKEGKILLIICSHYPPAYKAGGPVRAIANLVTLLKGKLPVSVISSDRDLGDTIPFQEIQSDTWIGSDEGINTIFLSPENRSIFSIKKMITELKPSTIYLNSMFDLVWTLYPLILFKMGLIRSRVILAPRGMLHESALSLKKHKKRLFLSVFRTLNLHKGIIFQATDQAEKEEILKVFPKLKSIQIVPDIPLLLEGKPTRKSKTSGEVKFYFSGRISEVKNVHFLLECLKKVKGKVQLDLFGPIEDTVYYKKCKKIESELPQNIEVNWMGPVPYEKLLNEFPKYHFLTLPSLGENFGHSIYESLIFGIPALIGNNTPFKKLEINQAGLETSPKDKEEFLSCLQFTVDMDSSQYHQWSLGARNYAEKVLKDRQILSKNLSFFLDNT